MRPGQRRSQGVGGKGPCPPPRENLQFILSKSRFREGSLKISGVLPAEKKIGSPPRENPGHAPGPGTRGAMVPTGSLGETLAETGFGRIYSVHDNSSLRECFGSDGSRRCLSPIISGCPSPAVSLFGSSDPEKTQFKISFWRIRENPPAGPCSTQVWYLAMPRQGLVDPRRPVSLTCT